MTVHVDRRSDTCLYLGQCGSCKRRMALLTVDTLNVVWLSHEYDIVLGFVDWTEPWSPIMV